MVRMSVLRSPTYGDVGDHKVLLPARRARGTGGSFLGARVRVGSGVKEVTVGTRSSSAPPLKGDAAGPFSAGVLACDVRCACQCQEETIGGEMILARSGRTADEIGPAHWKTEGVMITAHSPLDSTLIRSMLARSACAKGNMGMPWFSLFPAAVFDQV